MENVSEKLSGNELPQEELMEEEQFDTKKVIIFVGAIIGIITLTLVGVSIYFNRSQEVETLAETSTQTTTGLPTSYQETKTSIEAPIKISMEAPDDSSVSAGSAQIQKTDAIFSLVTDGILKIAVPVGKTIFTELPNSFPKIEKEKLLLVEIDSEPSGSGGTQVALKAFLASLPLEITKGLEKIEMYIFRGSDDFSPSEAILIKNNLAAEENWALVKKGETTMLNDWKDFILIGEKYDIIASTGQKEFTDGETAKTRYVNFTANGTVSLDYSAGKGYLLFANSFSIKKRIYAGSAF